MFALPVFVRFDLKNRNPKEMKIFRLTVLKNLSFNIAMGASQVVSLG